MRTSQNWAGRPKHRSLAGNRLFAAGATVLLVLLNGCGGQSPNTTATQSPAESRVEQDCGQVVADGVAVEDVSLMGEGGTSLAGAVLGEGGRGIVLLHQTNDGVCGWLPYAGHLATRGFHVLIFDRRCTGKSACSSGDAAAASAHAADVGTAIAELSRRGAANAVVVGASLGGSVAIGACAVEVTSGCVALSPAVFDAPLGDGLTAANAIARIKVPLLIAVAPDDPDSDPAEIAALARNARPGVVQLVDLPAGAGHGWDTVVDPADPDQTTAFSDQLITFLQERLP